MTAKDRAAAVREVVGRLVVRGVAVPVDRGAPAVSAGRAAATVGRAELVGGALVIRAVPMALATVELRTARRGGAIVRAASGGRTRRWSGGRGPASAWRSSTSSS